MPHAPYPSHSIACATIAALTIVLTLPTARPAHAAEEFAPMQRVTGRFDVKMTQKSDHAPDTGAAEYRLEKQFHGPLDATATGTMLGHTTATEGSAGYVAIERVTGTLDGKRGSFVLQHFGVMQGEHRHLDIRVVPDSADGELTGLQGNMQIRIEADGAHFYDLEYRLGVLPPRSPGPEPPGFV